MKLRIVSDLHLEINYFEIEPLDEDILILAGDISPKEKQVWNFISNYLKKNNHPLVFLILGNHDYYHSSGIKEIDDYYTNQFIPKINKKEKRVFFLQDDYIDIEGFLFYGTTLWTKIHKEHEMLLDRGMMDYSLIDNFTPADSTKIHEQSVEKLKTFLTQRKDDDKVILITHHLPSFKSIDVKYKHSPMTPGFASNLDDIIKDKHIFIAIHGHTHIGMDYMLEDTRVLCNPRGYVQYGTKENPAFDPDFIIEI
jgi:predicted phosphohydrolase